MLHDAADVHDDAGGQGEINPKSGEQVGEDGYNPFQQRTHNDHRDTNDRYRVDQRRFHRRLQLHGFFNILREALQDGVENTASLTSFDHVGGEVVKDLGEPTHGVRQRRAAFYRDAHAGESALEGHILLVGRKDLEALHQGQAGIDHDGELAEEDCDLLRFYLAAAEFWQGEFFALFLDGSGHG